MNKMGLKERIEGLITYAKFEGHDVVGRGMVNSRASGYISCAYENSLISRSEHDSYMDRLYSL